MSTPDSANSALARSYTFRTLQADEQIEYTGRLHWWAYRWALLFLALSVLFLIVGLREVFYFVLAAGLLAAWLVTLVLSRAEIAVTSERVVFKMGLLSSHTIELNRTKIESVSLDQSFLGKLLGFGTVTVSGSGGTAESIPMVADPTDLRRAIGAGFHR